MTPYFSKSICAVFLLFLLTGCGVFHRNIDITPPDTTLQEMAEEEIPHKKPLADLRQKNTPAPPLPIREKIVKIALDYRGVPYRYGGTSPKGFDCSGFTLYVFRKVGVNLPRTSSRQFQTGESVPKSDLKKGDLVFFSRVNMAGMALRTGHVGIYIGNNKFIHAPRRGKTIKIDSLKNGYWRRNYKGARSVL